MKIPFDVSSHCVQTAAKSAYEALVRSAFKATGGEILELEEKIEALRIFLTTADFQAIRSLHPALSGGSQAVVIFETRENGGFWLSVEGERLPC